MITCTAYGPAGPAVFLATTEDFTHGRAPRHRQTSRGQERSAPAAPDRRPLGALPPPEDRVRRRAAARSSSPARPTSSAGATPEQVLQPRAGAWWDSLRIGIGPPPLLTEHGWLLVYHGVKETVSGQVYRVGLALLDLDEPTRVLHRLPDWILGAARAVRAHRRRPERRLPVRPRPRRRERRRAPLLRRRRHLDLPRHRPARRPARGRARRADRRSRAHSRARWSSMTRW